MANPTIAEKVADELAARIVGGMLLPGSALRQEMFVQEFGASHASIREAFLRLEGRRLVIGEARRGFRVVELDPGGEREVVMMRAALEVLALCQLGERPNPKRMSKIEDALNAGEEARDLVEWEIANRSFHDSLAEASELPRLVASIAELNVISSRYAVMRDRSTQWKPRSNHDHRRIFEALCDGHIEQAASLLDNHIRAVERVTRI